MYMLVENKLGFGGWKGMYFKTIFKREGLLSVQVWDASTDAPHSCAPPYVCSWPPFFSSSWTLPSHSNSNSTFSHVLRHNNILGAYDTNDWTIAYHHHLSKSWRPRLTILILLGGAAQRCLLESRGHLLRDRAYFQPQLNCLHLQFPKRLLRMPSWKVPLLADKVLVLYAISLVQACSWLEFHPTECLSESTRLNFQARSKAWTHI